MCTVVYRVTTAHRHRKSSIKRVHLVTPDLVHHT